MENKIVKVSGVGRYVVAFEDEVPVPASMSDVDAKELVRSQINSAWPKFGGARGEVVESNDRWVNFNIVQ
jgi:hypothetical protein